MQKYIHSISPTAKYNKLRGRCQLCVHNGQRSSIQFQFHTFLKGTKAGSIDNLEVIQYIVCTWKKKKTTSNSS